MENQPIAGKKLNDEQLIADRNAKRMQVVKDISVVAGVGALSAFASNFALRGASLSDEGKGTIQAIGHTLLGGALALGAGWPRIGAGIVVGGVVSGAAKIELGVRTKMYLRQLAQPQSAPAATSAAPQVQGGAQPLVFDPGTQPAEGAFAPQPQRAYA